MPIPTPEEILRRNEKSQQARASRKKGKNFERELAKKFSEWWNVPNVVFRSQVLSGAFGKQNQVANLPTLLGDIYCNDENFPYLIESKFVESLNLTLGTILEKIPSDLLAIWQKLDDQALLGKKTPLLIIKQTRKMEVVLFTTDFSSKLALDNVSYCLLHGDTTSLIAISLDSFFKIARGYGSKK